MTLDPARPFASAYATYVEAGWLGTLVLPNLEKNPPDAGYIGREAKDPTDAKRRSWAATRPTGNIGLRLPATVVGIDVDQYGVKNGAEQLAAWEAKYGVLPPGPRSTRRDPDSPSGIRFFLLPEGFDQSRLVDKIAPHVDVIRHGHRYAVVAPSCVYEDEEDQDSELLAYAWYGEDGEELPGPPRVDTLPRLTERHGMGLSQATETTASRHKGGRTTDLTALLRLPGSSPERGNDWLTKVSGHLARRIRTDPEGALLFLAGFFDSDSDDPHDTADVKKTVMSVWKRELAEAQKAVTMDTGQLVNYADRIHVVCEIEDERGNPVLHDDLFANFGLRVLGKVRNADGTIDGYNVVLKAQRTGRVVDTYLPLTTLTSPIKLTTWLASFELGIVAIKLPTPSPNQRLQTLISSFSAPDIRIVPFWGWDDESAGFITDVGIIRASGLEVTSSVRPDPDLTRRKLVSHRYGFEADEATAVGWLNEVLTYQDPTVTSVVGAWWMATKLKGQLMAVSSLFPVMVVEAPSESGKTRGFFEFLFALDGNAGEQSVSSAAAFRSRLTAHRNGFVWLDDQREVDEKTREAIRGATGEKHTEKMDTGDNRTVLSAKLVAPVMLSGEGFGFNDEKAMPDRIIQIDLPSPKGRMSLRDPNRTQWDDITEFKLANPDLTRAAGTLTQMALNHSPLVAEFPTLRPGSGRHADKIAVLRVGARVLAAVTGDPTHIDRVDAWVGELTDHGQENALTKLLIPTVLEFQQAWDDGVVIKQQPYYGVVTPVLIRPNKEGKESVWVNLPALAEWWSKHKAGRTEARTHTKEALQDQAKALGMKSQKAGFAGVDWYRSRAKNEQNQVVSTPTWQRLPDDVAARYLETYGGAPPGRATRATGGSTALNDVLANWGRSKRRNSPSSPAHPE